MAPTRTVTRRRARHRRVRRRPNLRRASCPRRRLQPRPSASNWRVEVGEVAAVVEAAGATGTSRACCVRALPRALPREASCVPARAGVSARPLTTSHPARRACTQRPRTRPWRARRRARSAGWEQAAPLHFVATPPCKRDSQGTLDAAPVRAFRRGQRARADGRRRVGTTRVPRDDGMRDCG